MTAPGSPQWRLAPVLRLVALALLFSVGALMTVGVLSLVLWAAAVVLVVVAAVKLGKNWGKRR